MTDADFARFAVVLTGHSEIYKHALSEFTIETYWDDLREYDIDAVEDAFRRHRRRTDGKGAFMPKASELIVMLKGSSVDQAGQAWSKVDRAVRTVGSYDDVVFDDALIHRVIEDMGGWAWLGAQTDKEWPFIEKNFVTRYHGYRMRSEQPPHVAILTGIGNSANAASGQPRLPAVMVGDPDACCRVARGGGPALLPRASGHLRLVSPATILEDRP